MDEVYIAPFCFPPVDPETGEVSAADDAILMGQRPHCAVPDPHRLEGCAAVMADHGWIDDGSRGGLGTVVCPESP